MDCKRLKNTFLQSNMVHLSDESACHDIEFCMFLRRCAKSSAGFWFLQLNLYIGGGYNAKFEWPVVAIFRVTVFGRIIGLAIDVMYGCCLQYCLSSPNYTL